MSVRMILPIAVITLVLGFACTYMSLRSMAFSPLLSRHPWVTWGIFVFMLLIPIVNRLVGHFQTIDWVCYIIFGAVSTYIVYLGVADLFQFLLRRFFNAPASAGIWALRTAMAATIISIVVGYAQALKPPTVRRVEVPISGLNKSLEDFTIAQISDLHIDTMVSKRSIEQLTLQINELNPDVIAVTGDLVDGSVSDLLPKVALLGNLKPKNCVCFVTGNHEYYSGDLQNWLDVFNKMEWCVLMNNNVLIQRNDAKLAIIGIPDSTSGGIRGYGPKPDLAMAFPETLKGTPKILLHHKPTNFLEAERADIDLQLSGHTHAGQYFPWSAIIPLLFDFSHGLKRYKRMLIYTSAGTGFWGPPNRFLRPKELTLLVLKST
ncbi:MAG: metallophosphoesterase [Holophagales bacterium]|nr:metallophosphoesterase [Holophagales bacterium]